MKIISLLFLISCSKLNYFKVEKTITFENKKLQKYVDDFQDLYGQKLKKTKSIQFTDLRRPHVAGMCNIKSRRIYLNTPNWRRNSDTKNRTVVYHELGHCELGRGHVFYDEKRWTCSPSLMAWNGVSDRCFKKYYDYYINELFTGCRKFNPKELK